MNKNKTTTNCHELPPLTISNNTVVADPKIIPAYDQWGVRSIAHRSKCRVIPQTLNNNPATIAAAPGPMYAANIPAPVLKLNQMSIANKHREKSERKPLIILDALTLKQTFILTKTKVRKLACIEKLNCTPNDGLQDPLSTIDPHTHYATGRDDTCRDLCWHKFGFLQ